MNDQPHRSRMRIDLPQEVIDAAHIRATFDHVDPSTVVQQALEMYLPEEIALVRARGKKSADATEKTGKSRKGKSADGKAASTAS